MNRLTSLDAFRGATIAAMILVNNPGSWSHVYKQLGHAPWHGWTFTDVIFPFFLFIVGVAIVFAFSKKIESGAPKKDLYVKIIRRTLIIFAIGLIINGFPYYDLSSIRIMGVLQRIALCYFFASLIFLTGGIRWQAMWSIILLLVYWLCMELYPVPGVGAGVYEPGQNFSAYIDSLILSGHMWVVTQTWDPEGLFSTLPAIATTLFGILTGHLLRSDKTPIEKTMWLLLLGNAAMLLGAIWDGWLPINKNIWTSSYSVFMGGLALVSLAFFYYFIDLKGYKRFTQPFLVYGMNAITVYALSELGARVLTIITVTMADGSEVGLRQYLFETMYAPIFGPMNGSVAYAVTYIGIMYLIMLILYKKKIFIKI
jgi:predicted acyltransferase